MNVPINPQIIEINNKPAFAVIPWDEYQKLINAPEKDSEQDLYFPHEVVKFNALGDNLIKAWRKYLNLTQVELAVKAGMEQSALARIESGKNKPRQSSIVKLAEAMDILPAQLIE